MVSPCQSFHVDLQPGICWKALDLKGLLCSSMQPLIPQTFMGAYRANHVTNQGNIWHVTSKMRLSLPSVACIWRVFFVVGCFLLLFWVFRGTGYVSNRRPAIYYSPEVDSVENPPIRYVILSGDLMAIILTSFHGVCRGVLDSSGGENTERNTLISESCATIFSSFLIWDWTRVGSIYTEVSAFQRVGLERAPLYTELS